MMNRRTFLGGLTGTLGAPRAVAAQQSAKIFRVGALSAGVPRSSPHWVAFAQRLEELGYVEGRNISIEFRSADGHPDRFPRLMIDLVRSGVDVLLPVGPEASLQAAKEATTTIPIIVVAIDYDPLIRGYVRSLARPGGNITGVFLRQLELTAKRIEFLREVVPQARSLVAFWDEFSRDQVEEAGTAARSAGLQLQRFEFRDPPYRFEAPMREAVRNRAGAMLGLASPVFFRQRADLARLTLKNSLPAIVPFHEAAEAGILMSYGASLPAMLRRDAEFIDRIVREGRPRTCRWSSPRNSNWSSISRPPRRSASRSRNRSWCEPTKLSIHENCPWRQGRRYRGFSVLDRMRWRTQLHNWLRSDDYCVSHIVITPEFRF
jgi:putative tryptophan/tyrosine transport system substrate-binding protein